MTHKQLNCYLRLIREEILDVFKNLPEGEDKQKLQAIVDGLKTIVGD